LLLSFGNIEKIERKTLYAKISEQLGTEYHTAKISSVDEAQEVYKIILRLITT
jgi:hypothetical protein